MYQNCCYEPGTACHQHYTLDSCSAPLNESVPSAVHTNCNLSVPQRTSTPINIEDVSLQESFADPINEFFYQNWCDNLLSPQHSRVKHALPARTVCYDSVFQPEPYYGPPIQTNYLYYMVPAWTAPPMYSTTFIPVPNRTPYVYYQPSYTLGYRPDGTYGMLDTGFWAIDV